MMGKGVDLVFNHEFRSERSLQHEQSRNSQIHVILKRIHDGLCNTLSLFKVFVKKMRCFLESRVRTGKKRTNNHQKEEMEGAESRGDQFLEWIFFCQTGSAVIERLHQAHLAPQHFGQAFGLQSRSFELADHNNVTTPTEEEDTRGDTGRILLSLFRQPCCDHIHRNRLRQKITPRSINLLAKELTPVNT